MTSSISVHLHGLLFLPVFSSLFNRNNNLGFVLEREAPKRRQYTLNLNAPIIQKEDPHFEPPWMPEVVYNLQCPHTAPALSPVSSDILNGRTFKIRAIYRA
jgi:hypothetical protein